MVGLIFCIPSDDIRRRMNRLFRMEFLTLTGFFGNLRILYNDVILARHKKLTSGKVKLTNNVVVYLIYPKHLVQQSHIMALNYFNSKGFSPIIVSNLRLMDAERERLLPLCHLLIERPNFGYDFGGYRDGILSVADKLPDLNLLAIINDSVWFPVSNDTDWIEQVTALNVDFAGATCAEGISPVSPEHFANLNWDYSTKRKDFHYGSFALCIGNRILSDPDFLKFWRKYPLTNDRIRTINIGEKGLSQWVIQNGYTHKATANLNLLRDKIIELNIQETYLTLSNLIVFQSITLNLKIQLLLDYDQTETWADTAKAFILSVVAAQGLSYSLPGFVLESLNYPFMKKLPVRLNSNASNRMMRIARTLKSQNGKIIVSEIDEIRTAHAKTF